MLWDLPMQVSAASKKWAVSQLKSVSAPSAKQPPVKGQVNNITTAYGCQGISALVTRGSKPAGQPFSRAKFRQITVPIRAIMVSGFRHVV